eukprot:m.157338 g.157338  ORF g.157338 m.157338 type:complete len:319 (+) comp52955_c0_seq2:799-1755(+)
MPCRLTVRSQCPQWARMCQSNQSHVLLSTLLLLPQGPHPSMLLPLHKRRMLTSPERLVLLARLPVFHSLLLVQLHSMAHPHRLLRSMPHPHRLSRSMARLPSMARLRSMALRPCIQALLDTLPIRMVAGCTPPTWRRIQERSILPLLERARGLAVLNLACGGSLPSLFLQDMLQPLCHSRRIHRVRRNHSIRILLPLLLRIPVPRSKSMRRRLLLSEARSSRPPICSLFPSPPDLRELRFSWGGFFLSIICRIAMNLSRTCWGFARLRSRNELTISESGSPTSVTPLSPASRFSLFFFLRMFSAVPPLPSDVVCLYNQ